MNVLNKNSIVLNSFCDHELFQYICIQGIWLGSMCYLDFRRAPPLFLFYDRMEMFQLKYFGRPEKDSFVRHYKDGFALSRWRFWEVTKEFLQEFSLAFASEVYP